MFPVSQLQRAPNTDCHSAALQRHRFPRGGQEMVVRILNAHRDIAAESMTCCLEHYPGLGALVYPILRHLTLLYGYLQSAMV